MTPEEIESAIEKMATEVLLLQGQSVQLEKIEEASRNVTALEKRLVSLENATKSEEDLRHAEIIVSTWKKIVDTQMHFNDMVMRVRTLAITLLLAAFGAAAYSIQTPIFLNVYGKQIHIALFIIVFGLAGWVALWIMDLGHFHILLRGAVAHGMTLEKLYEKAPRLSGLLGMTTAISRESRKLCGYTVTAAQKLGAFYAVVLAVGLGFCWVAINYVHREDFSSQSKEQVFKVVTETPKEIILRIDSPTVIIQTESKQKTTNPKTLRENAASRKRNDDGPLK